MIDRSALAVLLCVAVPAPALADAPAKQVEQRAADIVAVMQGKTPAGEVFSDRFLAAVPEERLKALEKQLEAQFGPLDGLERVTPIADSGAALIVLHYQRAIASGQFQLAPDPPHKVDGFRLTEFDPIGDSFAKLAAELKALPGQTSLLLTPLRPDAQPVFAINADRQMALGSTFKLYVLSALARSIAAGEHRWDEVVPLTVHSLLSGQLQQWPLGAPLTLQSLATLMISISDNTAADQLIAVLGRARVEAELVASGHADPRAALPFLTTRESVLLKSGDEAILKRYEKGTEAQRRAILAALARKDLDPAAAQAALRGGPRAIDVEWYASGHDVAKVFRRIVDLGDKTALALLAVNPSMSEQSRKHWAYAGFKGGSEPGVLNLSWLLRSPKGKWYVLTMDWNDPAKPVDSQAFELLAQRALGLALAAADD